MNILLFRYINNLAFQNKILGNFAIFCAKDLPYVILVVAFLFFLFHRKNAKAFLENWRYKAVELICIVGTISFAWLFGFVIKNATHVPRPFVSLEGVHQLIPESGFSFPSLHTAFFAALAVAIYLFNKKLGVIFMLGAILIGLARIAVGVHYPVDILGGLVLGTLVAIGVFWFLKRKLRFSEKSIE